MTASLPTPLGPLMTTIKGRGVGAMDSELKEEPKVASKARMTSERSALLREGMGTEGCRDIRERERERRGVGETIGENSGLGGREMGNLKGKREGEEVQRRSLRNMRRGGGGGCGGALYRGAVERHGIGNCWLRME